MRKFYISKEKTEKKFAAFRLFLACLIEQGVKDSRSAADIVRLNQERSIQIKGKDRPTRERLKQKLGAGGRSLRPSTAFKFSRGQKKKSTKFNKKMYFATLMVAGESQIGKFQSVDGSV